MQLSALTKHRKVWLGMVSGFFFISPLGLEGRHLLLLHEQVHDMSYCMHKSAGLEYLGVKVGVCILKIPS